MFTRCVTGFQSGAAESKTKPEISKECDKKYISHDTDASIAFAFVFFSFDILGF